MKEYVLIPEKTFMNSKKMIELLIERYNYVKSLPIE